jgi:DOPA 4,5-dioxygenase
MGFPNRDLEAIDGWHAHIYYDPERTKDAAAALRERLIAEFPDTRMGRWHDEAVGPHLVSMYQVAFRPDQFDRLVQWLAVNRDGLSVLVHPLTENAYNDHVLFGMWMGPPQPLDEEKLKKIAVRTERRTVDITN